MITRRAFVGSLTGSLLAAPLAAEAQQAAKIARIGLLLASFPNPPEAFVQGLHDLGYIKGQNLVIEHRSAEGKLERLPDLALELVALKVDVLVTASGTPGALAAKQATSTIPIIITGVPDPVGSGLVSSLARPGGNVTGLSSRVDPMADLLGKRLELLKQAAPEISRIAVLRHPGQYSEQGEKEIQQQVDVWAKRLGVRLYFVDGRGPADFDGAFSEMARARADALMVFGSTTFYNERRRLVGLAAKNRLPDAYPWKEGVESGGLLSYGPSITDWYRRAATYVDKILKGARPADLPVERPTKFELVINLKTAKALGLTIPPSLLARADEVIQ